jgi:hypothetical protein
MFKEKQQGTAKNFHTIKPANQREHQRAAYHAKQTRQNNK